MASVRIHNHFNSRYNLGAFRLVFALALFLFLSVDSWGACENDIRQYNWSYNSTCLDWDGAYRGSYPAGCGSTNGSCGANYCCELIGCSGSYPVKLTFVRCSNSRDLDSLKCQKNGFSWNSSAGTCEDPSICAEDRKKCQDFGGTWSGSTQPDPNGGTCCSSYCNICNSERFKELKQKKIDLCCKNGYAPPADSLMCAPAVVQSGCGMSTAQLNTNAGAWSCIAPNDAQSMAQYNQMCLDSTSNDPNSSSGEGGDGSSSSGEGGGSSSGGAQYPEGCDECPWLDSILDTLTRQKHKVDDIYDCIVMPMLCNMEGGEQVAFDTSLLPYLRPYMDSSLRLDSNQIRILQMIDTNILKFMSRDSVGRSLDSVRFKMDSAMLKSDSVTRQAIIGGSLRGDSVTDALNDSTRKWLHRLADSLSVLNDSTRKYYGYLADSIGVSVDSLINHIDSIKNNIPKDVFDSILKYQKLLSESDDSIVVSSMPALDSLIDSSLKYWRAGIEYDSVRSGRINDSISKVIDQLDNMAMRMSYILGYGDTASTNLRGDLDGIKDGITDFRDSAIKYLSNISIDGDYQGAVVDGMAGIQGSVDALRDSLGVINGQLNQGSYDTNSTFDGYLSGHDTSAVRFATDLGTMLGGALHDSTYKGIFVRDSSTPGGDTAYRLPNADSLHQVLQNSNDSMKSALADTMQTWFNELRKDFMLVNFDSAIIAPLGAKVPNTNTCPEECFKIDLSGAGGVFSDVRGFSWGLCEARIGNMNVLQFIRLILRIVTALTCVYIGLWFISGRKS